MSDSRVRNSAHIANNCWWCNTTCTDFFRKKMPGLQEVSNVWSAIMVTGPRLLGLLWY